jgi:hypothetical protein
MAFKVKEKKNKNYNTTITLDATHNNKINEISNKQQLINEQKKQLCDLETDLNKDLDLDTKIKIGDSINYLKKTINNFESQNEEINYLLDNKNILVSYYEEDDNESTSEEQNDKKLEKKKEKPKKIEIMDFFRTVNNGDILNTKSDKKKLFDQYLRNINSNDYDFSSNNKIQNNICTTCNIEKTLYLSEGKQICSKCGDETEILIESDKPSYKDPPREVTYFSYKRINHFNEWLAQFQAKETTDIPKEIYEEIIIEINKERLDINTLSPKKLRSILKKIKKNKYYEHIPHILNKLNGKSPPIMSREVEEELRRMFKEIQVPFHKFCPKDRKNFLSYSYVLHKFVELLELDEFLNCFILLKSREKLHQQDQIWKQICQYLKWEYIPSI